MMGLSTQNAPSLDLPARFMALSMSAFAISVLTTPWSLPLLQDHFSSFSLLAFIHLNTLGFIGAMIFGASYQLVPVVLQTPLSSVRLGRISFWFYGVGLLFFLTGLLRSWLPGLSIGGSLLAVAFLLYIGIVFTTFLRAPYHEVIGWHVVVALVGAGGGMSIGVLMAFNKSNGMLGDHLTGLLAAHIVVMLAGWVGLTLTGVAYRLICMFTLAEKYFIPALAWSELALVAGGTWLLAFRFMFDWPSWIGQGASAMILAGFGCFAVQMQRLYRRRMRRTFDIHIPFAAFAAAMAIASAALLTTGLVLHATPNDPLWIATGWLAMFGVAGTAIQGFFYKISTFLVWLKRYAPMAGKQPVPKLEQLYSRRLAVTGWGLWVIAIIAGSAVILLEWSVLPLIGALMLGAAACFLINVFGIARHWTLGQRLSLREPVVPRRKPAT
jgi:hypothetical protein